MKAIRLVLLSFVPVYLLACGGGGDDGTAPDGGSQAVKYVAIGASDAAGIGADPLTNGYVFQIEDQIQGCNIPVELINLGIPGARIQQFEDIEVPVAVAENPDLVTIWAGANDLVSGETTDEFETRLTRVVSRVSESGNRLVAIANLPDLTQLQRFIADPDPDVTSARITEYNRIIAAVAAENSAALDYVQVGTANGAGFHSNPNLGGLRRRIRETHEAERAGLYRSAFGQNHGVHDGSSSIMKHRFFTL